jgi:hypothetical protein
MSRLRKPSFGGLDFSFSKRESVLNCINVVSRGKFMASLDKISCVIFYNASSSILCIVDSLDSFIMEEA